MPEVRLIAEDGNQVGVVKTSEALSYAQARDLDLVEVAPEARPPVVRVLDYSKYKYEQAQKQKAARRHQQQITVREIKFRPKIAQNDYDTKKGHVTRFLMNKDKVKITIMFRGREVTHPERGTALLDRLAGELSEIAVIEQSPVQDGRNMTMLLAPSRAVLAGERDKPHTDGDGHGGSRRKHAREAEANGTPATDVGPSAQNDAAADAGASAQNDAAADAGASAQNDAAADAGASAQNDAAADAGASAPADAGAAAQNDAAA